MLNATFGAMIKLLLVGPSQGTYGGIEAFVLAVAMAVRREPDFDVRVVFRKTKYFARQPSFKKMFRDESIDFCSGIDRDLVAAIRWADIVHLQNASSDVVLLTKAFRKQLVLTIHHHLSRPWHAGQRLWRLAARFADARWYNSQFNWDTWEPEQNRPDSRKVAAISNLPEGWAPPDERAGFVFVGAWTANKGIGTLVDAYALAEIDCAQWPLVLMGEGPLRSLLEYAIQKRRLEGIHVLGFVDEETKAHHMMHARWIVVPPHTPRDFSLAAVEARHLGVPCIITRAGGLTEAGGRHALVCEPADPAGLARLFEEASRMGDAEYLERAEGTRADLATELEPLEFYARSYRKILGGESWQ